MLNGTGGRFKNEVNAMVRVLIKLLVVVGSLFAAQSTYAQLRAPVTGSAQRWVQVGCDPCCTVTNLHAEKPVIARLFTIMGHNEARVAPKTTSQFLTPRNGCMRGGMGLEVEFGP